MISTKKLLYKVVQSIGNSWQSVYPVGSYYETSDSTFDPNAAWGGTWVLETAGQVHLSAGTGYTIGSTGGSADAIIPYHNHSVSAVSIGSSGSHAHNVYYRSDNNVSSGSGDRLGTSVTHTGTRDSVPSGGAHTHSVPAHNTDYAGTSGNVTGANLPPYIVVNRWHRTA